MKINFYNKLKNNNILERGMSKIPAENFVQFAKETIAKLENDAKIKRVDIELGQSVTSEIITTFYIVTKGAFNSKVNFIRFNVNNIAWSTKRYDETVIADWIEFLKKNLGDELYRKMLAYSVKLQMANAERGILNLKNELQVHKAKLAQEESTLKNWQDKQAVKSKQFKTEFADVLDENGNIIDL